MSASVVVLKFGSSVLRTDLDLPIAVGEIDREVRHQQRVIAVVSAYHGVTDQRFAQALRLGNDPHDQAAYVAQGEEESSTQLVRALIAHGVPARYLEPTAIDLCAEGDPHDSTPIAVERERLARALADHSVLVVPGYIAHDRAGRCVLLGRGGSDLTALFLAERLAARCRLLKDVDGVYESDPASAAGAARRFRTLRWETALEVAGKVIQPRAVRLAQARGVSFEVAAVGAGPGTLVGPGPDELEPA